MNYYRIKSDNFMSQFDQASSFIINYTLKVNTLFKLLDQLSFEFDHITKGYFRNGCQYLASHCSLVDMFKNLIIIRSSKDRIAWLTGILDDTSSSATLFG